MQYSKYFIFLVLANVQRTASFCNAMENFKTTYHTFKARDKNSYSIVEYRIQDLPEEYFECTLDLFVRDYITEETLYKSKKLWQNEASIKAIRAIYGETLQNHLAIGCFKNDGSDDLVGVNLLTVRTKNESKRNYFAVRIYHTLSKALIKG